MKDEARPERATFEEPEMRTCFICNDLDRKDRMETIDISKEDEYYPNIRYICWACSRDDDE